LQKVLESKAVRDDREQSKRDIAERSREKVERPSSRIQPPREQKPASPMNANSNKDFGGIDDMINFIVDR
jgi:hypothetical protein